MKRLEENSRRGDRGDGDGGTVRVIVVMMKDEGNTEEHVMIGAAQMMQKALPKSIDDGTQYGGPGVDE